MRVRRSFSTTTRAGKAVRSARNLRAVFEFEFKIRYKKFVIVWPVTECIKFSNVFEAAMLKHSVLLVVSVAMVTAHHGHIPELRAIARLADPNNPANIQGNITFTQLHDGKVRVEGTILGLPHGQYGFHIHEKGDITGGCLSTGAHFNPEHKQHGHPNDEERHVGDLGNVEFDDTRIGRVDAVDSQISLVGAHGILGRAVVLHEKADDFGRSDHPDSRKTGNAGGRVACGVIGILDPVEGWSNAASLSTIAPSIFLLSSLLVLLR